MRYDCRHKTDTRLRDAKVAQLQCAAGDPNERADPDFCDACTQGMGGDQPGTPGRPGECRGGRWELCIEGLRSRLMSLGGGPSARHTTAFAWMGIANDLADREVAHLNEAKTAQRQALGSRAVLQDWAIAAWW